MAKITIANALNHIKRLKTTEITNPPASYTGELQIKNSEGTEALLPRLSALQVEAGPVWKQATWREAAVTELIRAVQLKNSTTMIEVPSAALRPFHSFPDWNAREHTLLGHSLAFRTFAETMVHNLEKSKPPRTTVFGSRIQGRGEFDTIKVTASQFKAGSFEGLLNFYSRAARELNEYIQRTNHATTLEVADWAVLDWEEVESKNLFNFNSATSAPETPN